MGLAIRKPNLWLSQKLPPAFLSPDNGLRYLKWVVEWKVPSYQGLGGCPGAARAKFHLSSWLTWSAWAAGSRFSCATCLKLLPRHSYFPLVSHFRVTQSLSSLFSYLDISKSVFYVVLIPEPFPHWEWHCGIMKESLTLNSLLDDVPLIILSILFTFCAIVLTVF